MVAGGGEGENPLPPWAEVGGGRGGIPASFPSRSPPPKQPFQPTPTPSPGSYQEVCEKIVVWEVWVVFVGKRPQAPGGPGPKPWGPEPQAPWRPGPQAPGPGSRHSYRLTFLTSCCVRVSKRYHNPQSATLGGVGWFPKAELYSSMSPPTLGGVLDGCRSSFLPYSPKTGGGGVGGVSRPPPKQPFQPTPTPSPRSRQEVCEKIVVERFGWFLWGKGLGARAPSPLETWPTGPWGLDPATLTG